MGPMSWDDYEELLPQGQGFSRLTALVKNYIGSELMWDVNLVLDRNEIPPATVGMGTSLGRSAWLSNDTAKSDAADLILKDVRL